ncbi:CD302 antigen [Vipera latastei]
MGAPSPASYSACFLGGFLLAAALSALETDACPSIAWIPFQKSCYALLQGSSEVYSMDDARELCQDNASGADIITINSKDENTFIQSNFHSNWHGPEYVSLGMFFDTDDDIFKWYDDSEVNFTNWIEEESNNELLNTCATMHTASGGWKKVSCEHLPLTKILCETTAKGLYGKTYSFETLWTSIIVIISTIIVAISAAFLWFLYQRRIYSRPRCGIHNSIPQIPYDNGTFFIDEDEYSA